MAENSKIEWTHHTFNPWWGCTKIGPGCDNCYAEAFDHRLGGDHWGPGKPRREFGDKHWNMPLAWDRMAAKLKTRYRVFCASMADVFDNEIDPKWRDRLWTLVGRTQNLDWLILTKRIGNAPKMLPWMPEYTGPDGQRTRNAWRNVWLGSTVVNREEMLRDGPKLKAVPAHVRFWSVEPMLGDFGDIPVELIPDWVIVGGESGHGARRFDVSWPRSVLHQCRAAGVPCLVKQLGDHLTWDGCSSPGEHWPVGTTIQDTGNGYFRVRLKTSKGGAIEEWPEDLRIREYP